MDTLAKLGIPLPMPVPPAAPGEENDRTLLVRSMADEIGSGYYKHVPDIDLTILMTKIAGLLQARWVK